ncbi:hypothetical protein [Paraglaciecola chathamensis]|uniref:hypothetical protein n=1 Tax=Paraglaciecola chathamensis TaxID=368405 RepID=UPI00270294B3|nr:hypothetical protein [Paraglaciecola chathamensis]MDO6559647.1 hypothetical protein [Paraglaciecola chathamensis]
MNKYCYVLASVMLFQGCTSISQPTASRPLVEHEYVISTPVENDSMQRSLSNISADASISIDAQAATLGPKYFSASGVICRSAETQYSGQYLFCQNALKQWYRVKSVISTYNENISEVKP